MPDTVLNAKDKARLQRLVEARNSQAGKMYATEKDMAEVIKAGFVEVNPQDKDGNKVAMRASDAGVAAFNAASGGGTATERPAGTVAQSATKPAFTITKAIALPAVRRREEGSKYPFDVMEIGDSFHVSPTAEMPDPVKSMGSSVSAANRRYSEKVPGKHKTRKGEEVDNYRLTRKYVCRPAAKDDPEGVGARIWRTELPANPVVDGSKGAAKDEPGPAAGAPAPGWQPGGPPPTAPAS